MNYDCHLEVCGLTHRDHVANHLRRWKPSGVVFVQMEADRRSRSEWMTHMDSHSGACGVAMLTPSDRNDAFARLMAIGVCGVLHPVSPTAPIARIHDDILRLHEVLPRYWHVELDMSWTMAALLAPLLARMDRTFCLTPQFTRTDVNDLAAHKLLWWFDMGNAYLKLTGAQVAANPQPLTRLVCRSAPDRVVLGSGEPQANKDFGWSEGNFIPPDQADDNAKRLYPFFKSHPIH